MFLENLEDVRSLMIAEIEADIAGHKLYVSPYLSLIGRTAWPGILLEAAKAGDDETCANGLRAGSNLRPYTEYAHQGTVRMRKVPHNAAETFACGEFNVFYMRATCRLAIYRQIEIEAYRGRYSATARRESTMLEGRVLNPHVILEALRNRVDGRTNIGLGEPNSGMTIRLYPSAANDP